MADEKKLPLDRGYFLNNIKSFFKKKIQPEFEKIQEDLDNLQLYKTPNAVIYGEPTINNGQISDFSATNYLAFPFLVDFKNKNFTIDFAFTTSNNVTNQENLIDGKFGLAIAIKNSHFVLALSSDGVSWNIGVVESTYTLSSNTTYYARLVFDGVSYNLSCSVDKEAYTSVATIVDNRSPHPVKTYIGIGDVDTDNPKPFGGIIDLNNSYLTIDGSIIWQGMDDTGIATRANISLSNIDADGIEKIKDVAETEAIKDSLDNKANKTDLNLRLQGSIIPSAFLETLVDTSGTPSEFVTKLYEYTGLNTAIFYRMTASSNSDIFYNYGLIPTNSNYFLELHIIGTISNFYITITKQNDDRSYIRRVLNGVAQDWKELATTDKFTSSIKLTDMSTSDAKVVIANAWGNLENAKIYNAIVETSDNTWQSVIYKHSGTHGVVELYVYNTNNPSYIGKFYGGVWTWQEIATTNTILKYSRVLNINTITVPDVQGKQVYFGLITDFMPELIGKTVVGCVLIGVDAPNNSPIPYLYTNGGLYARFTNTSSVNSFAIRVLYID